MDGLAEDFLRRVLGDVLDVHAAFGAGDDDRRAAGAIEEDGEVEFLARCRGLGDEDLADELAFRPGLVRDERLAEHLAGDVARLLGRCRRGARRP